MPHSQGARGSLSVLFSHLPLPKGVATPGNISKGRILEAPALTQLRTRCGAGAHQGFSPLPEVRGSGLAVGRAWSCLLREATPSFPG